MHFPTFDFEIGPEKGAEAGPSPELAATLLVLRRTPLFTGLSDEELDAVARCAVPIEARAGSVVIGQGEEGRALYLVASGRLRVEKNRDGRSLLLGELVEGDAFGEMSLIHPMPTSARVTAVDDSQLLTISRLDLDVLLNWNTILAAKMWRSFTEMLAVRLREMNERMVEKFGE